MANYKFRQPVLAMSEVVAREGVQIVTGMALSNLRFGRALAAWASSPAAGTGGTITMVASGAHTTDAVFVTSSSLAACMILGGASCIVDDAIVVAYYNRGAVEAPTGKYTFAWLAIG